MLPAFGPLPHSLSIISINVLHRMIPHNCAGRCLDGGPRRRLWFSSVLSPTRDSRRHCRRCLWRWLHDPPRGRRLVHIRLAGLRRLPGGGGRQPVVVLVERVLGRGGRQLRGLGQLAGDARLPRRSLSIGRVLGVESGEVGRALLPHVPQGRTYGRRWTRGGRGCGW